MLEDPNQEKNIEKTLSSSKAQKMLEEGKIIQNQNVDFLNFRCSTFNHPVIIKNCTIKGILAKGTTFNKTVVIENCQFEERVDMSALKEEEGLLPTIFKENLEIKNCQFKSFLSLRNSEIDGNIFIKESNFQGRMRLEKAEVKGDISLIGPGKLEGLVGYSGQFSKVSLENYHITGFKQTGIEFNSAYIKTLSLVDCVVDKKLELRKTKFREKTNYSLYVNNCTIGDIELTETRFGSKVHGERFKCQKLTAKTPKEKHGKRTGRPVLFSQNATFIHSEFLQKCNFNGAIFEQFANFKKCKFHQEAIFNQVEFMSGASFWESESIGSLHFRKAHFVEKASFINVCFGAKSSFNEATFEKQAHFFDSEASGDIYFSEAHFQDLNLRKIKFQGGLGLSKITVDGELNIANGVVKDRFVLTESQINGRFIAPGLNIGTWAGMNKCHFNSKVILPGLKTGTQISKEEMFEDKDPVPGSCYFDGSVFQNALELASIRIKGDLCLDDVNSYNEIDLTHAKIGKVVFFSKSFFRGVIRCDAAELNELVSKKARYKEEISLNRIKAEKVSLTYSSFDSGFTLRSAEIKHSLNLSSSDVDGKADLFKCEFEQIFFHNFIVDNFLIDREALGKKLDSEIKRNFAQARIEYGILKQAFHKQNHYKDMDWAYYRFCRTTRKSKKISLLHPIRSLSIFFNWLFLDLGFGYGTRPMNIALVALIFVLAFAGAYHQFPQGVVDQDGNPMQSLSPLKSIYLSLITFASMDYGTHAPNFDHWLKFLFSIQGLLGIFFTTLFVATISRKIIRT